MPRCVREALVAAALLCCIALGRPAHAASPDVTSMVLAVAINGEPKGEFFVYRASDGSYLVKLADLAGMGLGSLTGKVVDVDGEPHLALGSVTGIETRLDENSLTLEIAAAAGLLGSKTLDLLPQRRREVLEPRDPSAFLNYRVGYAGATGGAPAYSIAAETGARLGDWLFLSNFSHLDVGGNQRSSVRLMSNATLDRRAELQRLVVGDFFTAPGDLGSNLNLGGVSFSKRYSINPYLVKQPMAGLAGAVAVPSQAEIYVDGLRVRTEALPAGQFLVQNLNYYGGARDVEVVIKDRFGREQRIQYRYYFTDTLLRQGLHEYSYDIGRVREDFGSSSNHYGELAASAFHRYGFTDALTLGLRGEAAGGRANGGPEVIMRLGTAGITSLRVAASRDRDAGSGHAAQFAYDYQTRFANARLLLRRFSEHYAQAAPPTNAARTRFEGNAGFGYGTPAIGNIGVDFTTTRYYDRGSRSAATLSYSKPIAHNVSLLASFSRVRDGGNHNEAYFGLSWYPGNHVNVGYSLQDRGGTRTDTLQASKNAPTGEGWGYRLTADRLHDANGEARDVSPFVQYNGPFGIYTADYRAATSSAAGAQSSYQVSMAGAIGYVGGTFGFSRPIDDSFGVVRVGELQGVRVYQSNQVVGRTNANGSLFVPNLGSYVDNQIAIEDKDIPFEYAISGRERYVSPPLRSGSVIAFGVTRIQAFTGTVKARTPAGLKPAEYYEGQLLVRGKPIAFVTGNGGALYLENVEPGAYEARLSSGPAQCIVKLAIPDSKETVVELGELVCEPGR